MLKDDTKLTPIIGYAGKIKMGLLKDDTKLTQNYINK